MLEFTLFLWSGLAVKGVGWCGGGEGMLVFVPVCLQI